MTHGRQLGHVEDTVTVLDLHDHRGHVPDDLVQAAGLASLVDPGQVLLEEVGVLLVAHGGVGGEIDHDAVFPSMTTCTVLYSSDSAMTSASSMLAHSGRRSRYSSCAGKARTATPTTTIRACTQPGVAL